jgi:ATP-dependent DNA helicase RecG
LPVPFSCSPKTYPVFFPKENNIPDPIIPSSFSRKIGQTTDYSRVHAINRAQHEDMVIQYINSHKRIERKHVMELCDLSNQQAGRLLKKMCDDGKIMRMGTPPRWTYYVKS